MREANQDTLAAFRSLHPEIRAIGIFFDGSDDEGQCSDPWAVTTSPTDEDVISAGDEAWYHMSGDSLPNSFGPRVTIESEFTEGIADYLYDVLESHHSGWEINAGSFGVLVIDLNNSPEHDLLARVEINKRYESHESSFHAYSDR